MKRSIYHPPTFLYVLAWFCWGLLNIGNNRPTIVGVEAMIACQSNRDCQSALGGDSVCVMKTKGHNRETSSFYCTNPFAKGCLQVMEERRMTETAKGIQPEIVHPPSSHEFHTRVCNSDDQATNDFSNCRQNLDPETSYPEIRIAPGDWESPIFLSWIMQIILGEVLNVPVTIETSRPRSEGSISFYDVDSDFVFPATTYNYAALKRAQELKGDCNLANRDSGGDPCAHYLPEVWSGQKGMLKEATAERYIEIPEGNGMVGKLGYFIPRIWAEKDPSLSSWFGLRDRRKMAETFLGPTSWLDYCNQMSESGCEEDDGVALRRPRTTAEEESYFWEGLFKGFFRATEQSNCTLFPDNCTGHVIHGPCRWGDSTTESHMYWNNIRLSPHGPLEPNGGYSYSQMLQIWSAANATSSAVLMWWWLPGDSLNELYADSDYALYPITMPPATEECDAHRVGAVDRCSSDLDVRLGDPLGSCGSPSHALQKVISSTLEEQWLAEEEAFRSPAYKFLKQCRIDDLSITTMLQDWITMNVDPQGSDPRAAVCGFVYDNLDMLMERSVPDGYPRVFHEEISTAMTIASYVAAFVSLGAAVVTSIFTWVFRKAKVFRYAYLPFVAWLLVGLSLILGGSLLVALPPTDSLCVAQPFFIVVGFSVEMLPLLVKVAAVNRMVQRSEKMKKVQVNISLMHFQAICFATLMLVYVVIWTLVDPRTAKRSVFMQEGESEILLYTNCRSNSEVWYVLACAFQGLILIISLVMAIQSRKVKQQFNESQSLALMVFSHTFFLLLRCLVRALPTDTFPASNIQTGCLSVILSLDALSSLLIYFFPKFCAIMSQEEEDDQNNKALRSTQLAGEDLHDGEELQELIALNRTIVAHPSLAPDVPVALAMEEDFSPTNRFALTQVYLLKLKEVCYQISQLSFDWESQAREQAEPYQLETVEMHMSAFQNTDSFIQAIGAMPSPGAAQSLEGIDEVDQQRTRQDSLRSNARLPIRQETIAESETETESDTLPQRNTLGDDSISNARMPRRLESVDEYPCGNAEGTTMLLHQVVLDGVQTEEVPRTVFLNDSDGHHDETSTLDPVSGASTMSRSLTKQPPPPLVEASPSSNAKFPHRVDSQVEHESQRGGASSHASGKPREPQNFRDSSTTNAKFPIRLSSAAESVSEGNV